MAGLLNSIEISSAGMSVQRARMNVTAQNIANAETVETREGGPYRRKRVQLIEKQDGGNFNSYLKQANTSLSRTDSRHIGGHPRRTGDKYNVSSVEMKEIQEDNNSFRLVHDPSHPNADEDGFVRMPDIEIVNEMVDMLSASRAYEANASAIAAAKNMAEEALKI